MHEYRLAQEASGDRVCYVRPQVKQDHERKGKPRNREEKDVENATRIRLTIA